MQKRRLLNQHRRIRELLVRPMPLVEVRRWAWTALLLSALAQPIAAQIPSAQAQKSEPAQKSESSAQPAMDPLGRSTPRGTIMGFLRAVEKNDASAVRYLEVNAAESPHALSSARDLRNLIDRYLKEPLAKVSDSPDGTLNDGLPTNRERVGPLVMGDRTADITLVRVTDPQAGPIWLISSQTLAQVPSWSRSLAQSPTEQSWLEQWMPKALLGRDVLGLSVAHWIVLVVTLLIPFALLVLIFNIAIRSIRTTVREPSRLRSINAWYAGLRWPLIIFLTVSIQLIWMLLRMRSLGFTLTSRVTYARVALVLDVIALAWLLRKFLTLRLERTRRLVMEKDRTGTESLVLLGERLLRALVFLVAVFAILAIVGVNTKTALAGLGIGGIALALGAQRTVENLLGGILLLSDKALAIGDFCSISNRVGVVEDITLRSVRLRTLDRTLVSIPAGALAQSGIENFATREKILAQSTLRLRYGTSVEQLTRILGGIREVLDESSNLEPASSRIRLVNFGAEAIELEVFAYVLTADFNRFLELREELLLRIASVVEAAGSGFAPTRFIYMQGSEREVSAPVSIRDADARRDQRPARAPSPPKEIGH
jgi:MscS family membrane protein